MSAKKKNVETGTVAETNTVPVVEKPAAKAKVQGVTVMYIGPSIPNVVQASTVFKDGILSAALKKCVEEKPYMTKLLVPLAELPTAMKELNSGKGALSTFYRRVKNEI